MSRRESDRKNSKWHASRFAIAIAVSLLTLAAGAAHAEHAWVRDGLRLNLRTGPGTQFRILRGMGTGDGVEILARSEDWTQIRTAEGETGWIPVGFLQPERPAILLVEDLRTKNDELRSEVERLSSASTELRDAHDRLAAEEGTQRAELERLTMDNMRLRAGARYPEWITGAAILATGMVVGALLRGSSSRRQAARIRL